MSVERPISSPDKWDADSLISIAERIATMDATIYGPDDPRVVTLRELARRYRLMIEHERKRWESARQAFGPQVGPKEVGG